MESYEKKFSYGSFYLIGFGCQNPQIMITRIVPCFTLLQFFPLFAYRGIKIIREVCIKTLLRNC